MVNTTRSTSTNRTAGILLILQFALIFVPIFVLGNAINWPASLDEPTSTLYPQLVANLGGVRLGYTAYLIYSTLFLATAVLTVRAISGSETPSPWLQVAMGAGVASALARDLGIIRWLSAMPELAALYVDPQTSVAQREAIDVAHRLLNDYGGAIGEQLGVGLFAALWALPVSVALMRMGRAGRMLGVFGLISTIALLTGVAPVLGYDLGPITSISTTIVSFWFLALGIWLLRRNPAA
jgi:hypothetical protein